MATLPCTRTSGLSSDILLHYPTIHQRPRSNSLDSDRSQMSGYHYSTYSPPEEADYESYNHPYPAHTAASQPSYSGYDAHHQSQMIPQHPQLYHNSTQYYQQAQMYQQPQQQQQHQQQQQQQPQPQQQQYQFPITHAQTWPSTTLPSNYPYQQPDMSNFPAFSESMGYQSNMIAENQFEAPAEYLSPREPAARRSHRSTSLLSEVSSLPSPTLSDVSRSASPNAGEMARWGVRNSSGSWSCAYPGCTSRSTFNRGCDLRKHYKRHTKSLFCRVDGCPQATEGGFSSKKDRARHEAKHNPSIVCEWDGCDRLFSRQDNMKDHVRRVHKRRTQ